ncbi:hypothetical protein EJB05_47251, partial [Eragrostis curvula]
MNHHSHRPHTARLPGKKKQKKKLEPFSPDPAVSLEIGARAPLRRRIRAPSSWARPSAPTVRASRLPPDPSPCPSPSWPRAACRPPSAWIASRPPPAASCSPPSPSYCTRPSVASLATPALCLGSADRAADAAGWGLRLVHVNTHCAAEVADTVMALILGLRRRTHLLSRHALSARAAVAAHEISGAGNIWRVRGGVTMDRRTRQPLARSLHLLEATPAALYKSRNGPAGDSLHAFTPLRNCPVRVDNRLWLTEIERYVGVEM